MMNINQYKFKSRHLVSWFQSSDTKCVFFEKLVSFLMKKHEIFEIPKTNFKVMTIEVIQSHLDHLKGSCLSLLKFVCFRSQVQRRHKPADFGINLRTQKKHSKKREWHGIPSIVETLAIFLHIFAAFFFAVLLHTPGFENNFLFPFQFSFLSTVSKTAFGRFWKILNESLLFLYFPSIMITNVLLTFQSRPNR